MPRITKMQNREIRNKKFALFFCHSLLFCPVESCRRLDRYCDIYFDKDIEEDNGKTQRSAQPPVRHR